MTTKKNLGFDPEEIQILKKECTESEQSFMYFEDEDLNEPNGEEFAHIHFVGQYEGKEVIYDCVIYTLRLHHGSLVYEAAEQKAIKAFPLYIPIENRDETYQANEALDEEVEVMILEFIEEIEETEEIKVQEHIEMDVEFDYGIGLDVALNVDEIDDEVIEKFVKEFNAGNVKLDQTLYSFKSEEE